MIEFYHSLVNHGAHDVRAEYERWLIKWNDEKDLPSDPATALLHCDPMFYPAISKYLKIFCCIPATTATPERNFSTLKYLKCYLRSSTTDSRLNGLTQLYLNRDFCVDIDGVIDRFAAKKRRAEFAL